MIISFGWVCDSKRRGGVAQWWCVAGKGWGGMRSQWNFPLEPMAFIGYLHVSSCYLIVEAHKERSVSRLAAQRLHNDKGHIW